MPTMCQALKFCIGLRLKKIINQQCLLVLPSLLVSFAQLLEQRLCLVLWAELCSPKIQMLHPNPQHFSM